MRDGFPANFLDPSNIVLSRLLLRTADRHNPRTMVQQFGGGVEQQIGRDFVASVDVIGSTTDHLAVLRNLNQNLPGTRDANGPLPYPNFGNVQWREMTGEASYKGVDLSFEKRFSKGYSYRASYTIGDARDQAPEHLNASSGRPQNGRDLESWEGPSDFDIRHRLVANFIAELPFGDGKAFVQDGVGAKILGGWMVTGIYSARTGRPMTITQGNNNVAPADRPAEPDGRSEGRGDVRAVVQPGGVHAGAFRHVRQRRPQHPARARLGDLRHERAAAGQLQRPRQRDPAVGHLQHVQPRELRAAAARHHQRDRRRDFRPRRRSARDAAVVRLGF